MQGPKFEILLVANLSDQELDDVASISDRAYRHAVSPAAGLLTGGKLELIFDLFRAMTHCCMVDGECYIARDTGTQKIVGTALWFPPGKQLWDTDELRRVTGFNTFFDQLDQRAKDWWLKEYREQVAVFMKEHYGPESHAGSWWLNNVAVLPEYQAKGVATSLLERVLEKAATNEAVGLCTDSEKNVRFYKSLRFEEVGSMYMRNPEDGSAIKVWGFKQYGLGVRM